MKNLAIAASIVALATFQAIGQPKYTNRSNSTLSVETSKSSTIDPNYKHQAGTHTTETEAATLTTQETDGYDANYKHQAGRRREHKRQAFTVKATPSRQKFDGNYKHQFPSN